VIGRVISPHGAATRLSGDEFAAYVPRRDLRATVETAELIVRLIQEHHFQKDSIVVHPTISIGVAMFPEDSRTPWDLLARADEALLRAKRGGRNRVSI
jgi:diguanylate cyclase (GGDEF)-like protein